MKDSNQLVHLQEFKNLLASYYPNEAALEILKDTRLVLLAAPTSMGRNTLIRELIRTGKYHYLLSDTTRQPRVNDGVLEKDGDTYWFRSEEQMLDDLRAGKFIEAAVIHNQQVSGANIREVEKAHELDQIAVSDIEVVGIETYMKLKPDTIAIFVLPPSFDEWQRRLLHRGFMPVEERRRRLQSACKEFEAALTKPYYHFVINDVVAPTVQEIDQIVETHHDTPANEKRGKELAAQLLQETKTYLETI